MRHSVHIVVVIQLGILLGIASRPVVAQSDPQRSEPLAAPAGTLFLHGGGHVSAAMRNKFTQLAGGSTAKIIVVPTADVSTPTDPVRVQDWLKAGPAHVDLLHAQSRQQAEDETFSRILDEATGVWFSGGKQGYLVSVYHNTPVIDRIRKVIDRGGVVGGTSAGAAIASTPMLIYEHMQAGFEFLPGTIIDQHFLAKNRLPRLVAALDKFPSYVGFGIDEETALVVRGKHIQVLGKSTATVVLAKSKNHAQVVRPLMPGEEADLIELRRLAQSRQSEKSPIEQPGLPEVLQGSR